MKSLSFLVTLFAISLVTAPPISAKDSLTVGRSDAATSGCDDPKGYSVEEGTEPDTNSAKIVRGDTVLHIIKLPTQAEVNGFAVNWVKKTKEGFEIAIEYGTRIYYEKRFIFICKQHKFYLSKMRVSSFDKHNPEKWSRKVIRVRPSLPIEKFSVTDFMLEMFPRTKRERWNHRRRKAPLCLGRRRRDNPPGSFSRNETHIGRLVSEAPHEYKILRIDLSFR